MTHRVLIFLAVLSLNLLLPPPSHASLGGTAARWPLEPRPRIVRGFEPPPKPWLPGHRGVDLAGSPGQAVLSAADGVVRYAGQLAGRGTVVVSHGATRTTYEPVVPSVRVGTVVRAGDQIGRLSTSGSHCLPDTCLHWGLLRATTYLDPLSLLTTPTPVRLLPLNSPPSPPSPSRPSPSALPPIGPPPPPHAAQTDPPTESTTGNPPTSQSAVRPTPWGSAPGTAVVCLATLASALTALLIRHH